MNNHGRTPVISPEWITFFDIIAELNAEIDEIEAKKEEDKKAAP